jgi:hypothetical protein
MSSPYRLRLAAVAVGLGLSSVSGAQVFVHGNHPDPAAQEAAAARQRAIREHPDQFGTACCQVLQIPASSFVPIDRGIAGELGVGQSGGYAQIYGGSVAAEVWAPLTLPTGVGVDFLDLYYYDNDATWDICVDLWAYTGTSSPASSNLATTCSVNNPGFGYASTLTSFTIDNDAVLAGAQYVLIVSTLAPSFDLQFKAVDVWWHRQVSPPPVTATFNDVPTNHPFFQFVEALSASQITAGCQVSPPLFCPDAPLTRKQMAAFLSKALGLYWPF